MAGEQMRTSLGMLTPKTGERVPSRRCQPRFPEPGSTGTDWRIHYALLDESALRFLSTDGCPRRGDVRRFPVAGGDIMLGDRRILQPTGSSPRSGRRRPRRGTAESAIPSAI